MEMYSRKQLKNIINSVYKNSNDVPHQLGPDYVIPAENIITTIPSEPVKLQKIAGTDCDEPISIVTLFKNTVSKTPAAIALSVKRDNQWVNWTYEKYLLDVRRVAKAFIKLGLTRFQTAMVLGFNAPEWFITFFGTIFAGSIVSGIYTTNTPDACQYVLNHSKAHIVVVENDLQLKKILQKRDSLPYLKVIIQYTGTSNHEDVFSWNDILQIGDSVPDHVLETRIQSIAINQCCSIIYTSGTTGNPKGTMLQHDNYTYLSRLRVHAFGYYDLNPSTRKFTLLSYLPLSHIGPQMVDLFISLHCGGRVYFAQPDVLKGSLPAYLIEIKPYLFGGVPRMLEKLKEKIEEKILVMNYFKRRLINWAMKVKYQDTMQKLNRLSGRPFGYSMAEQVINKIVGQIGLSEAKLFGSSGAPMSVELSEFYKSLGIVVQEGYGLTESGGAICSNVLDTFRQSSCGALNSCCQIEIDKPDAKGNGEILIRGRVVCMGYLHNEQATKECIDSEGWLHTGDIGQIDNDGFLFITGRIKELVITAGGENVAPIPIEDAVKNELPIVSQAILIGDKRKFLSVLLTLKTDMDMETLTSLDTLTAISLEWCRTNGSKAKTIQDILKGPDTKVMEAIQKGIDKANEKAVSNACRIQKWKILPKDFSIQDGELNANLKLKRFYINEKYKDVINRLYE